MNSVYELFESARDAVRENASIRRRIERMASSEGMRSGSGGAVRAGFIADRMARTDARIDYEAAVEQREADNWLLVDYATAVLYGTDQGAGLAAAFGIEYADAIWWRYLADCKWADVADAIGCSVRTAQTRVQVGVDFIDSNGVDETLRGENGVTE